jgi:hypothetical protein
LADATFAEHGRVHGSLEILADLVESDEAFGVERQAGGHEHSDDWAGFRLASVATLAHDKDCRCHGRAFVEDPPVSR